MVSFCGSGSAYSCVANTEIPVAEQTGGVDGVFNWLKRSYIEEDIKEIDKFGLLLCIRGSDDKIVATIGLSATDPEIRPKLRQRILETIELAVPVVQASQSSQSPVTSEPATAVSFSEVRVSLLPRRPSRGTTILDCCTG